VDYLAITGADPLANSSLTRAVAKRLDAGRLSGASTIFLSSDVNLASVGIDAGSTKQHALMNRRAELLDPSQSFDPAAVLLSDFWIEESLAVGRVVLEPRRQRELEKLWTEIRQRVIVPKLIVVLEATADRADANWPIPDSAQASGDRILQQARRPDVGPVLFLDRGDMELAIEEVVAAALAMRG
jgi:hypothetical protein